MEEYKKANAESLLENLRKAVGCEYISDMAHGRFFCDKAKAALKGQNLELYSLHEITDAIHYIYGNREDFPTKKRRCGIHKE